MLGLPKIGTRKASTPTLNFGGIVWGDSARAVKQKLESEGYEYEGMRDDDVLFRGRFLGCNGQGIVYMTRHGAVRVSFFVQTNAATVLGTYDRLKRDLTHTFGSTNLEMEVYREPYAKGDGRAADALAEGKLSVGIAWLAGKEPTDGGCFIEVNRDFSVFVVYESPRWHKERTRRGQSGGH